MTMNEKVRIASMHEIAKHYGLTYQLVILAEECAELTQASTKCIRGMCAHNKAPLANLIEEIADVEIAIEEIKHLTGIEQQAIDEVKDYKIRREFSRIDEEAEE